MRTLRDFASKFTKRHAAATDRWVEEANTYAKLFYLSGKVAIVTGSGQGIGKCIADGLAAFGAKVIICDIEADKAEKTAREISVDCLEDRYSGPHPIQCGKRWSQPTHTLDGS